MTLLKTTLLTAALGAGLATSPAFARELNFAIGHPPGSYTIQGGEEFAKTLSQETGGALSAKVYAMSLLNMAETSSGLREGLADIGTVMSTYFPAEFPATNFLLDASMLLNLMGEEAAKVAGPAYAGAMAEYVMLNCPECTTEFAAQNQVYTGAAGTPGYGLNCTRPVASLEQMKGARLRIGGAAWARWSEAVGATPVTMSGNEMLEALSQGVLDCIVLAVPDVQNFGMGASVKHVTLGAPGGVYIASLTNVNREVWQELSEAERGAFMKAAARANAVATWAYHAGEAEVLEKIRAGGVQVHQADAALRDASAAFVERDLAAMSETAKGKGLARAPEMLAEFRPLVEKWVGLTKDISDAEALTDLYWREVYSKVDVTRHGF
ncbi:C4-dicarboxylate TRAP transporter substrate-binding protein [Falsigemmobacter faecalis]|uniref:C4-dicarboxylate ABC transporter substrate-binding protein n=1 Tax=Falsigemmobacter faecalis TaxID=2488730 RepID=A0A3P3DDP4_9RHOB|nr:C4-dicarboxylate TRAP transporter substrate-binding protein [Falsigemmobacter faecalis]RRH72403.1 C4-dicarboxylate ABC transporter substrate-binding protein [Falsigemmobacter faecalis]